MNDPHQTNPDQPIKLQLNVAALNLLFPEGSTARVELQAAVVKSFAKNFIGKLIMSPETEAFIISQFQEEKDKVDSLLNEEIRRIGDTYLRECGGFRNYDSRVLGFNRINVALNDEAKKLIQIQATDAVDRYLNGAWRAALTDEIAKRVAEITNGPEFNSDLVKLIEKQVRQGVLKKLALES